MKKKCWRCWSLAVPTKKSAPRWEYRFLHNALSRDPGVEVGLADGDHLEAHEGVFGAAELGALAKVGSGDARIDPHAVDAIGYYVGFAGQARDPEAVRDIGGLEPQVGRSRICRRA